MKYTILVLITLLAALGAEAQPVDSTLKLKVHGVCGLCKARIEKAVKVKGVRRADWDMASQELTVTYDPLKISREKIIGKVTATGHDTEFSKAENFVYDELPECCRYRDEEQDHAEAVNSENSVQGNVLAGNPQGGLYPLTGATVQWLGTDKSVMTDKHGFFSIPLGNDSLLIVSHAGFVADTIPVSQPDNLHIVLGTVPDLQAVVFTSRRRSIYINSKDPFRIANISEHELQKAACCNLSESFETNPSVDVQYNDAVTGSRQIQLLGLAGIYTQLTVENLPGPRGLSTPLGLNSIAGPWVESIQLSKGTGSVVNGFESIAGQINVELKKPEGHDEYFINGYINNVTKTDINVNITRKINDTWSAVLLLHDDFQYRKMDQNGDGFRDLPTGNLFSAFNRLHYNKNGISSEFGFKILNDRRVGGELDFRPSQKLTAERYGIGINTSRYEAFLKAGYIFPDKKYKSVGIQLSGSFHDIDAYYGIRPYTGRQDNFFSNLIYQNSFGNTAHKFRTGISFTADRYREVFEVNKYLRNESTGGLFYEYTYGVDKLSLVAGGRVDRNSLFGWFVTPRINARYSPWESTSIRISAGRGQRTANIFAENISSFISSRYLVIEPSNPGGAYGMNPEVSWNKGISIDQKFKLLKRQASASVEFFRNDFSNQVVTDLEEPGIVRFYNLRGKSFSNSLQAELNFMAAKNLDIRLAYRWFEVRTTYGNNLLSKPFNARHRAFTNLAYATGRFKFDMTYNYTGAKRLPAGNTLNNTFGKVAYSPAYHLLNAQVSSSLGKSKKLDVYVGGENLTNFFQRESIIGTESPFGNRFDASMIWGPVSGRMIYGGFRYTIK